MNEHPSSDEDVPLATKRHHHRATEQPKDPKPGFHSGVAPTGLDITRVISQRRQQCAGAKLTRVSC